MVHSGMNPYFDGLEGDPATAAAACPGCATPLPVDAWAFSHRARSGDAVSDAHVAAFGLDRRHIGPFRVTRIAPDGVAAYVGEIQCPGCGRVAIVCLGLGEVQPARWMAWLVGVR